MSMYDQMILHVIWIPGTRMITCGIGGLSRGISNQGVLGDQKKRLMKYVTLNLNVVEIS